MNGNIQREKYELTAYDKFWLNTNKCGDFIVMAIGFVENTDETNSNFNQSVCQQALDLLQKRHPFLCSYLDQATNCIKVPNGNETFNPIELEFSNNMISYSELIKELEEFNSKLFNFEYKSNLSRCKVASFVHLNKTKMYSINLSVSLIITDGINIKEWEVELEDKSKLTYYMWDFGKFKLF